MKANDWANDETFDFSKNWYNRNLIKLGNISLFAFHCFGVYDWIAKNEFYKKCWEFSTASIYRLLIRSLAQHYPDQIWDERFLRWIFFMHFYTMHSINLSFELMETVWIFFFENHTKTFQSWLSFPLGAPNW